MKKILLLILFSLFLSTQSFAGDKSSKVFTGIGSMLVATYSTADSLNYTSGYLSEPYFNFLVYVTVDSVGGAGSVKVYMDYSPDGTYFYPLTERVGNTDSLTTYCYTIDTAGSYSLPFASAGKYFRVRIEKTSGTSTAVRVTRCDVEGKS